MTQRRRPVAALLAGVIVTAVAVMAAGSSSPPARGAAGSVQVYAQPVLGLPASNVTLLGSAPAAPGGEQVVAVGQVRGAPPVIDGVPLDITSSGRVLMVHGTSGFWQILQALNGTDGKPLTSVAPFGGPAPGRVTPSGGAVLVATDRSDPLHEKTIVFNRDRTGPMVPLPEPAADDPPSPIGSTGGGILRTGESLVLSPNGLVMAAVDQADGHTGVFFGLAGRAIADRVAHWDGTAWSREDVIVPPGTTSSFRIQAIAASGPDNVWMLARAQSSLGLGFVLFQRVAVSGGAHEWVQRSLGPTPFAAMTTPAKGIADVTPGAYPADPLTVTARGVWMDGSVNASGGRRDVSVFYDIAAGAVTGSWCDSVDSGGDSICDHPLGVSLSTDVGYRSFAWPDGAPYGTRIITNPLDDGGDTNSNEGTYLRLDGAAFTRVPGAAGSAVGGAFSSPVEGWLGGPQGITHISTSAEASRLQSQPAAFRRPLTAVAQAPNTRPGAADAQALAVGSNGTVARYTPGQGWVPEFLLTSRGTRATPNLRGVAWPDTTRAYAVGDGGAMWIWRAATGLWEKDEAAPFDLLANFMDVGFAPGSIDRGYAVGKSGTLLHYDKTWTQDQLPAGWENADLTKLTFAGSQAIVAAGTGLLVNDGSGWTVDQGATDLVKKSGGSLFTVAGLADGGAVAAGHNLVIERDGGPGTPWRLSTQPLAGTTGVAVAAVRAGDHVRAIVSGFPTGTDTYPQPDLIVPTDPSQPPVLTPPFVLPGQGFVLRETADGWADDEHLAFNRTTTDLPYQPDPVLALDLDTDGHGWAIGGETGTLLGSQASSDAKARVQTSGISRYPTTDTPSTGVGTVPVPTPAGLVRFAIAGNAACAGACSQLGNLGIGPDVWLTAAQQMAGAINGGTGARAFLYTGGRVHTTTGTVSGAEEARYAAVAAQGAGPLPFFGTASAGDVADGTAQAYREAFAQFPSPFGGAGTPPGISTAGLPGAAPASGARTHYAFDSSGDAGTVRVVVIDNAAGSLAAADPNQNPHEPQEAWLRAVLRDARTKKIPAIVVGSRDLNSAVTPASNVAADADHEAQLLVDGGASAYFFDRPDENRQYAIPAGGTTTIPSFGSGTLGYGPTITRSQYFSESGVLLAQIDAAHRDAITNRAPVTVRLIPVIGDLAIDATDGTLLRRSRQALFQALARRPVAGSVNTQGSSSLDPYIPVPPTPCVGSSACTTRIEPEFTFTSSSPDFGDFVRHDPQSSNPRAVYLDAQGHTVSDPTSGLFCAFNAGVTTVTISVGGRAFSTPVTVQAGSPDRPCGTRKLDDSHVVKPSKPGLPPPTNPPPGTAVSSGTPPPPPAPIPVVAAAVVAKVAKPAVRALRVPVTILPAALPPPVPGASLPGARAVVPPAALTAGNPIPPTGAVARVFQVEEKREEEVAPEQSSAFSAYDPDQQSTYVTGGGALALLIIAAGAGASLRRRRRPGRGRPAFVRSSGSNPRRR